MAMHVQKCRDRPDFAAEAEIARLEGPKPQAQADWEACPNCGDKYGSFALGPHTRRCLKVSPYGRNGFGSGPPPDKGFFGNLFGPDELVEQTGLSPDEIARLRSIFERFDTSKNGTLEAPELVKLLRECFPARAASEASNLLAEFELADSDGNGRCDFAEFCRYYVVLRDDFGAGAVSEEEMTKLRVLFARFDEDGDGQLTKTELSSLLRQCFPSRAPSVKKLTHEFTLADLNGDGGVSFDEFLRYHNLLKEHGASEVSPVFEMFHFFDADGSGALDRDEFLALLNQAFPENVDDNEQLVEREFRAADSDGSKGIDFDEFKAYHARLSTLYEGTNQDKEATDALAEAEATEKAAAEAAAKTRAVADAAKAVSAARDPEAKARAMEGLKAAKAAAKAAAEEAMRAAMEQYEEEAADQEAAASAVAQPMVACKGCGEEFLPMYMPAHQRSCAPCKPSKVTAPPSSDDPDGAARASIEFADNDANTFVPCGFCSRTFFPDRLPVHHRTCKAKIAASREARLGKMSPAFGGMGDRFTGEDTGHFGGGGDRFGPGGSGYPGMAHMTR